MEFTTVLFYIFALLLVVSGLKVITSRNPVSSHCFLVLAFFNAAAIWMLLQAEFLAILLVLVYVGAVMVLFLFVVMMLDINIDSLRQGFWKHLPLAGVVGALIALEMAVVLMGGFRLTEAPVLDAASLKLGNTKLLGIDLYTNYLYPLEIAAVLLLVAIIAAIALTLRRRKDSRAMNPAEQVKVKKGDRLKIVKMNPTIELPTPAADSAAAAAAAANKGAA
jgi:NADH-quinone oxidoreductase subunit J